MKKIILSGLLALAACSPTGQIEEAIRAGLNDPFSAKIENVERVQHTDNHYSGVLFAKNSFGAYVKSFFLFDADNDQVELFETEDALASACWRWSNLSEDAKSDRDLFSADTIAAIEAHEAEVAELEVILPQLDELRLETYDPENLAAIDEHEGEIRDRIAMLEATMNQIIKIEALKNEIADVLGQ